MADYPKQKCHLGGGGGTITVVSAEQEKALGAEWVDYIEYPPAAPPETKKSKKVSG